MRKAVFFVLAFLLLVLVVLLWPRQGPAPGEIAPAAAPRAAPLRVRAVQASAAKGPAPLPAGAQGPAAAPPPEGTAGDLRIHGRVVDDRGTGVAAVDLEVRAWSGSEPGVLWTTYRARTGPDGSFTLPADRARATRGFGIETAAEGTLEGWVSLKLEDYDEQRGVEVVVEAARAILGRVVDEYARPIPRSTVQLWYGSETTWPTAVDAEGRFRTPARAPRRAFDLIVEAPGHPRRTVPIPATAAEEATDVGDLVFRRGGRIAGVAVDAAGRPLKEVPLCITGIAGGSRSTRTDDGGRFEFADLGEGTVGVFVDAPGTAPDASGNTRSWSGGLDAVAVGRTDLKVVLTAETIVVLRFVDAATGEPVLVTKSEFGAWPSGASEPERPGRGSSSSTPYGTERMTIPSGIRYDVLVRSPGFEDARLTGLEVPDVSETTVDVPMRRSR